MSGDVEVAASERRERPVRSCRRAQARRVGRRRCRAAHTPPGCALQASGHSSGSARRLGEAEQHVLHLDRSELRVLDGRDRPESAVLRVVHHVGDVVDGATAASAASNAAMASSAVRSATQAPTAASSSSACSARPRPGDEPRLVDQLGAADKTHHPLGDRLCARRDAEPAAVGGHIGVARRVVDRAVAGSLLDDPKLVVDGRLRRRAGSGSAR